MNMETDIEFRQLVARNIKSLVEHKGITLTELAKKSGLTLRGIQYILNLDREPKISAIHKIATALSVTSSALLTENLDPAIALSGKVEEIAANYLTSDKSNRKMIELQAKHGADNNKPASNEVSEKKKHHNIT